MIKSLLLLGFFPTILTALYPEIAVNSNADCWPNGNNNTIEKRSASLIRFSTNVAYEKDSCSIHLHNPWVTEIANGFGLFLSRDIDCSATVTIDCLNEQMENFPLQWTCHTSNNRANVPCNSISLTYKRNLKMAVNRKITEVQVVPLAKKPCDEDIFFQCPRDYKDSCIDRKLHCNGRSECPSGDDEMDCSRRAPAGIPIIVIILIVLAFLFLLCVLSTVLICCCCRAAFNRVFRRFRTKKNPKGNVTVTGEDAGLMKGLAQPTNTVVDVLPHQHIEPQSLVIDSTKPVYPRLE